jgi:hypothetical protein
MLHDFSCPADMDVGDDMSVMSMVDKTYMYIRSLKQETQQVFPGCYGTPVVVGFVSLDLLLYMNVFWIVVCPFVLFLLANVLSVLRCTASDYSFGIFKLVFIMSSPAPLEAPVNQ